MLFQPLCHEIDEALERLFLLGGIERPGTLVDERAGGILEYIAKEILKAAVSNERVPFEIEEDVAVGWLRSAG